MQILLTIHRSLGGEVKQSIGLVLRARVRNFTESWDAYRCSFTSHDGSAVAGVRHHALHVYSNLPSQSVLRASTGIIVPFGRYSGAPRLKQSSRHSTRQTVPIPCRTVPVCTKGKGIRTSATPNIPKRGSRRSPSSLQHDE